MQYYLWWAAQGSRPVKTLDLPSSGILVRAIRCHDDHAPMATGSLEEYRQIERQDPAHAPLLNSHWTDEQLGFVGAPTPVRFIFGGPGSGKTSTLWRAIEALQAERVLYVTWSGALANSARAHFQSFAQVDVDIVVRDFGALLGELRGKDLRIPTLDESYAAFRRETSRLPRNVLGPWQNRPFALFSEMRAHLIGRVVPSQGPWIRDGKLPRVPGVDYRRERGTPVGVGQEAASALLRVAESLADALAEVFPEFWAAAEAIERLRRDDAPSDFLRFERIVVDEAQDLTLLEVSVIVEICRAIYRRTDRAPRLFMAADEGQTVRPSGFDLGAVADLIARRVASHEKFDLPENLRCPDRIVDVIERVQYADLEKGRRPKRQKQRRGDQQVGAHLIHVIAGSESEAEGLLERLNGEEMEGVQVLSPAREAPSWLRADLRDTLLTPATAKGLEFQSVVLLEPGKLLEQLHAEVTDDAEGALKRLERRTALDQLRVSLSRATETLVFLDVNAGESALRHSRELLGSPATLSCDDLVEHFLSGDATPDERALSRIQEARELIDELPARAWQRAHQAVRLLGEPELPNGVSDESIRREAHVTLAAMAARLLVDGAPSGLTRSEVLEEGRSSLVHVAGEAGVVAFDLLEHWTTNRTASPLALLNAALALGDESDWLRNALHRVEQGLRQAIEHSAGVTAWAKAFDGDVVGWLSLTRCPAEKLEDEATRLRIKAIGTLLESEATEDLEAGDPILDRLQPSQPLLRARLRERQRRHEEAAEIFEAEGQLTDAIRNWRLATRWDKAIGLLNYNGGEASSFEKADLEWLLALESVEKRMPEDLLRRLNENEIGRFRAIAAKLAVGNRNAAAGYTEKQGASLPASGESKRRP
jgi:hypothetical protein